MHELIAFLLEPLSGSDIQTFAIYLLRNIPGMPPTTQTFHIMGIAIVMGSIVMLNLRTLGIALSSQHLDEMTRRLMPWFWGALVVNLISGSVFIAARPERYLNNPIFEWKITFLIPAVLLALLFHRMELRQANYWTANSNRIVLGKVLAAISIILWILIAMAGRWIAYVEYLYY